VSVQPTADTQYSHSTRLQDRARPVKSSSMSEEAHDIAAAEAQQQGEEAGVSGADVAERPAGEGSGGKQQDGTGLVRPHSSPGT
jgi:hypothetical protein